MYVIKNVGTGKYFGMYVSKPGSRRSYTNDFFEMKKFSTREEAEKEICPENEIVIEITEKD